MARVFEVRSRGKAKTEPTGDERSVACPLCGRRGLLDLGWKEPDAIAIPWKGVLALQPHAVLVRGSVDSYTEFDAYRSETR